MSGRGAETRPAPALPAPTYPAELPIAARREEIIAAIRAHPVVIVCGETGSGKTTQLPKMLIEAGVLGRGLIGHTQPRRIAARAVAARLAEELSGFPPGFVGFKVRFTDETSPATAIKLMTDGILLAEARHDPLFRRYAALIVDEAHERSLNIDFLLGLARRALERRTDLKLIVTSATIDTERFAAFFGAAPVIEVSGRGYPVELRWRPLDADADDRFDPGLTAGIVQALEELTTEPGESGRGDVLVFLPGEREIRDAAEAIEQAFGEALEVLPLYSRLAWSDQQRVFQRRGGRRVVLATNVAETSLTVPGIRAVVDSGLARISHYSARAKILRLPIEPVSQASARQRAGRCGRLGPGVCIRLYAEEEFAARAEFTPPEVLRTNLASVILQMETLGLGAPDTFPFIDAPETRLVNDGYRLLEELEAVDGERRVTDVGREMARLPVDPRLARMLIEARRLGALEELIVLVAGLSIRDPRERPEERAQAAAEAHAAYADPGSDFLTLLALWRRYQAERAARTRGALRRWCAEAFLSAARMREWEDLVAQLGDAVAELGFTRNQVPAGPQEIHRALLTGLLGSIGEKTERGDYLGPRGLRFVIAPGTPLKNRAPRWLMAGSLVDTGRVYARQVAQIEPAWIEAAARHLVRREYTEPTWDAERGIVTASESVSLYGLTLAAGRRVNFGSVEPAAAREIFVREALVHGRSRLRAPFLVSNAREKAALAAEEAALRRHAVLVEEEAELAFYLARIPDSVHSLVAFERWRREAERAQPRLLYMAAPDLRRPDAPPLDRARYPDTLVLAGNRLPVEYRFAPREASDGATVSVPDVLLAKLDAGETEWGIPAWLEEKLTALIRALPKAVRRALVPAPDVARRTAAELEGRRGEPFFAAVAAALSRAGGEPITAEALTALPIPEHLRLNLRVLGAGGEVRAEGRDLALLKRTLRASAPPPAPAGAAPGARADPWSRAPVREFDFAEVPPALEVVRQGVRLELYPAVRDEGAHAALVLLADRAEAAAVTRRGVLRLLVLALAAQVRHAEGIVAEARDLLLLHQPIGPAKDFTRQVVERAVERACLGPEAPTPTTREEFERAKERGRPELAATTERLVASLAATLNEHRRVRRELEALPAGLDPALVADVRAALEELIYPGFVRQTPEPWLGELPRLVKAVGRRGAKLLGMSPSTAASQRELAQCRARLAQLRRRVPDGAAWPAALAALKWQVAEYGVQLFAQDLGTSIPVSAKRLAASFGAAEAHLAAL